MVQRVLIVCPRAFAWGWGGDTPRLLKMAQSLHRGGWIVELLSCRYGGDRRFDSLVEAFPGRVITASFYGPFSNFFNRTLPRRGLRFWWQLRGNVEREDYPEIVAPRLLEFGIRAGIQKPALVFGYTGGHLESFVSAQQFSKHFGCPLVLEFRDPVPPAGKPALGPVQSKMLESCLRDAALIITTTNGIGDLLAKQFPYTRSKLQTIYSCFDGETPPAEPGENRGNKLVLVHAGRLFGGPRRNARSIIHAIAEVVRIEPAASHRILLRLIGAGIGAQEVSDLAQDLGVPWAVEVLPQMSDAACQEELRRADVLVVIKHDDPGYDQQIPGKLFQCLGFGKPILGMMRQTEAAEILRKSGLGLVYDHSDVAGTAAALLKLVHHVEAVSQMVSPNWEFIRQFSFSEMTRRYHEEFVALTDLNLAVNNSEAAPDEARDGRNLEPCKATDEPREARPHAKD